MGQFASNWELGMYLLDEYLHDTLPPQALEWAVGENLTPEIEALVDRSAERWSEIARSQWLRGRRLRRLDELRNEMVLNWL